MGWIFLRFPEMFFSQDPEFRGFCLERLFGQTLFPNTKEGLIRKFAGDMLKWFWSASIVKGVKITLDVKEKPLQIEFLRIAWFEFLFCARSRVWTAGPVKGFSYTRCANRCHQTWIFDLLWWELIQTHRVRINTGNAVFSWSKGWDLHCLKVQISIVDLKKRVALYEWWLSFQFATWRLSFAIWALDLS